MNDRTTRILLVEDNAWDARFLRELARKVPELEFQHVDRLAAALEHLATQKADVVLLDLGLPDSQGLDTLRALVQTGCAVPVVVITGQDDEAVGHLAVREGAQDYLIKSEVDQRSLTRAIRYAIERGESQARRRQAEDDHRALLASMAQSDRLASMGMLAAGVAHEINNPLSYILFNIESLAEDLPKLAELMRRCYGELSCRMGPDALAELLGDEQRTFTPAMFEDAVVRLREALEGTHEIRRITRSLGTFSRVEHAEASPVDVQASIEHAITMAFNEIKYRARLVKDFSPVPAVLGSDGKLAQVFLNLLINAAHAIDEGRVEHNEIRIRTWAEGAQVLIEVSDTGKGISPEHLDRVFEPFFTTKGAGVGSGLGLSICKNIVTGFGGEIGISSEVGKGTRFRIRLPQLPPDWQQQGAATPAPAPERPAVRGRILVVDDEDGVRAILVRMLGRDHEVVCTSSGAEGKALLEKDRHFDLIFCDLMMPQMSGMELHAWMREQDPGLAERVVFITGGAFTPGAATYLSKVGNLRIEKPFDSLGLKMMTGELILAARTRRGQ